MLFGLFTKKEEKILSRIGVDIHSHLIPGIDDGVKDYEIALSCICEIVRQGVQKIYVTPHFQTRPAHFPTAPGGSSPASG